MLKNLFTSQVRLDMLNLFLFDPEKEHYVREVTRQVGTEINAVRRELDNLEKLGLVRKWPRGNRLYYQVVTSHPLYHPLLNLAAHEFGLGGVLVENRHKLGKIRYAFLSQALLLGRSAADNEVDLFIVGEVYQEILKQFIRQEEKAHGHEINYMLISEGDFRALKSRKDPFLYDLLREPRIMLIGDEAEMVKR